MFSIIILLVVTNYVTSFNLNSSDYTVELIQVIFRHGDRTPTIGSSFPTDPYNSTVYEPFGYGELTNKGKHREYQIGKMLRKRYGDLLTNTYKPEYVYAYSTYTSRTIMSLQLVLAGLYMPSPKTSWSKKINWIPIPVYSNPSPYDFLSIMKLCPEFIKLYNEVVHLPEVQDKLNSYEDFLQYLSKYSGLPANKATPVTLYNTFKSQLSLGLSLPDWCTKSVWRKLEEMVLYEFELFIYTNSLKKLVMGPIIKRFLANLNASESQFHKKKVYLYSAHDFHVSSFSRAHNFTHSNMDYGTTIIFEKLKGIDKKIYVRFLRWSAIHETLTILKLQQCDEICPLSKYLKIVEPILPLNEGTECLYESAEKSIPKFIEGSISDDETILLTQMEKQYG